MAPAGQYHRHAVLVARRERLVVTLRSAGLDDRGDARRGRGVGSIAEREEGVRGEHGTVGTLTRLGDGDPNRIEPAHLPRADADELPAAGEHDRVRLDGLADTPG